MSDVSDALRSASTRSRTHNAQIVLKLPAAAKVLLRTAAETQGVSDSSIVRQALAEWFEKRGYRA